MTYSQLPVAASHVVERNAAGHWAVWPLSGKEDSWWFITGGNGTSRYLLRHESGVVVARTFKVLEVGSQHGERMLQLTAKFAMFSDDLLADGKVVVVGRRAGALTWFSGTARYDGSNIDGGVIHRVFVSGPHRRKGVASAMLHYAQARHPELDIRHSDALSEDGAAFAAATPTPNDVSARRATTR